MRVFGYESRNVTGSSARTAEGRSRLKAVSGTLDKMEGLKDPFNRHGGCHHH